VTSVSGAGIAERPHAPYNNYRLKRSGVNGLQTAAFHQHVLLIVSAWKR
jgi:hypothetical protein